MNFKHLTPDCFSHNPFQQPSMEGLWEDIKKAYFPTTKQKSTDIVDNFDYSHESIVNLFFAEIQKRKVEFKSGTILAGKHTAILVNNGKIPTNILSLIEKEISFLNRLVTSPVDEKYSALVKEVLNKANAVTYNKDKPELLAQDFAQLVNTYGPQLEKTPVRDKITQDILFFSKNLLVNKLGHYDELVIYGIQKTEKDVEVPCCDAEMAKRISPLIQDLTHLLNKAAQKIKKLSYYNEDEHVSERWRLESDDGDKNAKKLETWLLNYRYDNYTHSPYLVDIVYDLSLWMLSGLCYWVRNSIVDLKDL